MSRKRPNASLAALAIGAQPHRPRRHFASRQESIRRRAAAIDALTTRCTTDELEQLVRIAQSYAPLETLAYAADALGKFVATPAPKSTVEVPE